jgi:hypothetical protein
VIREHDSTAANANGFGGAGDVADENGCGRTGEAGDGVMFGEPNATVTTLLGVLGEVDGTRYGGAGGLFGVHTDEVEDGNGKWHGYWMSVFSWRVHGDDSIWARRLSSLEMRVHSTRVSIVCCAESGRNVFGGFAQDDGVFSFIEGCGD